MQSDQTLAEAFNALAHPRRIRLFRLLNENPEIGRSVGTLQQVTGFQKAALLHHLRVLERAGLLARRRSASTTAHILKPGPLTAAIGEVQRLSAKAKPAPGHTA